MIHLLASLALLLIGHMLGSLAIYANHRFILHGWLGKTWMLGWARRLHAMHHKYAYVAEGEDDTYHRYFTRTPLTAKIVLVILLAGMLSLSVPLGLGLLSSWCYYEFMHRMIHGRWRNTYVGSHHELHHRRPKGNFAGVHPWMDTVFRSKHKT